MRPVFLRQMVGWTHSISGVHRRGSFNTTDSDGRVDVQYLQCRWEDMVAVQPMLKEELSWVCYGESQKPAFLHSSILHALLSNRIGTRVSYLINGQQPSHLSKRFSVFVGGRDYVICHIDLTRERLLGGGQQQTRTSRIRSIFLVLPRQT